MNKKSMCRAINCLMHAMRASPREGIPLTPSTIPPRVCVCVCMDCGLVNRSLFSTIHLYLHAAVHPELEPEHCSSGPYPVASGRSSGLRTPSGTQSTNTRCYSGVNRHTVCSNSHWHNLSTNAAS